MGLMRHRIFIGSSSEERSPANGLKRNLITYGHTVKVWDQGVFAIGKFAFESLLEALDKFDAAVFIFAPNDFVKIRGREFDAVRDNVVFELGLFTGRLGRDRTFWLVPKGQTQLRIASDLLGVLPAEYVPPTDTDWASALSVCAEQIHEALRDSARERGKRAAALADTRAGQCLPFINRVMDHLTNAVTSDGIGVDDRLVESLPDDGGFRVRFGNKSELSIAFGRIEDFGSDDVDSVVALPANEFFDDTCVVDLKSALGSYVKRHFGSDVDSFTAAVAKQLEDLESMYVERGTKQFQSSYGVSTSLRLGPMTASANRPILCAVTRKRAGEGIKAEPAYIFSSVQAICRIMNDDRLTRLYVPVLGSGHGDLPNEVALFCLVLALVTTPDIRSATIVVFRKTRESPPDVSPEVVRKILAFAASRARR